MEDNNYLLMTDSYKVSHPKMYPEGMEYMESYFESRGGEYTHTVFFGLQYYIKKFLTGRIITKEKIDEAYEFYGQHFGDYTIFDREMWQYIVDKYDGHLPISILAVPEGSLVPVGNILFKVVSTDPKCAKLVNWSETLLMKVWYPTTIATNSMLGYEILDQHRHISSNEPNVNFLLHDFGYRGVTCEEQAWIGGAAHLLSFRGTDNVAGIRMLQKYYNAPMCGWTIPATEHTVMIANGQAGELETVKRILRMFPKGKVSIVLDTWNIFEACMGLASDQELKQLILEREGTLVVRPDSGDPKSVLQQVLAILAKGFGNTVITKVVDGVKREFKLLPTQLRVIQGDGIDIYTMNEILDFLESLGWSMDNLVFGSGGGLLQKVNRDTIKAAIKACYITVNGEGRNISKNPITAGGSKKSKEGQIDLYINEQLGYLTLNHEQVAVFKGIENYKKALVEVYRNGSLIKEYNYSDLIAKLDKDKKMANAIIEATMSQKEKLETTN